ncbi:unnamed protein product [Pedinophyceae sp. YPF-701]|nr:unnamed protein product [Pedinophyceae sp. YPF-701]
MKLTDLAIEALEQIEVQFHQQAHLENLVSPLGRPRKPGAGPAALVARLRRMLQASARLAELSAWTSVYVADLLVVEVELLAVLAASRNRHSSAPGGVFWASIAPIPALISSAFLEVSSIMRKWHAAVTGAGAVSQGASVARELQRLTEAFLRASGEAAAAGTPSSQSTCCGMFAGLRQVVVLMVHECMWAALSGLTSGEVQLTGDAMTDQRVAQRRFEDEARFRADVQAARLRGAAQDSAPAPAHLQQAQRGTDAAPASAALAHAECPICWNVMTAPVLLNTNSGTSCCQACIEGYITNARSKGFQPRDPISRELIPPERPFIRNRTLQAVVQSLRELPARQERTEAPPAATPKLTQQGQGEFIDLRVETEPSAPPYAGAGTRGWAADWDW